MSIQFCTQCENKLYHNIQGTELVMYCRVCGLTTPTMGQNCVLETSFTNNNTSNTDSIVNQWTKHDPTLPHISVKCPNDKCNTNTKKNGITDAVYVRYDHVQLKYLYICTECDFQWKSSG